MNPLLKLHTYFACLLVPVISHAAGVEVAIKLISPDALDVSYTLPENCPQLPFVQNGEGWGKIRGAWQIREDCGSADGSVLLRGKRACPVMHFKVPATVDKAPQSYPGAFPMGGGIYVHTTAYAVTEACGKVSYRFAAPGSIAMSGRLYTGAAQADEKSGPDMSVLLLQEPLPTPEGGIAYFNPALPPATVAQIREVADGTVSYLRAALPDVKFKPPILAATVATEPGGPNVGGDAGDVLRLSFYNWPQTPSPEVQRKATLLVSHEFSHRFQLRDEVDVYPDARLIHEGGAEFLRWYASLQKGWLTRQQVADELDDALGDCLLAVDGQNWRALAPDFVASRRLEYRCGLAVYAYALAARQGGGNALSRINNFYVNLARGNALDFGQAMECGNDKNCQAHWLPQLLGNAGPMREQWNKFFKETGLATVRDPSQSQIDAMMNNAVAKLMRDDCEHHLSMTPTAGSILLEGLRVCKTLRSDIEVTQIEGHAIFGNSLALPAMIAACNERHALNLGGKNGEALTVPCPNAYQASKNFYAANIGLVLEKLMHE